MLQNSNNYNEYEPPKWGFYLFSEIINGRIAMIGLLIIVFLEIITKKNLIVTLSSLVSS